MKVNGSFIRTFGQERQGQLRGPSALHIADKYFVYVSDCSGHCIKFVVYETSGQLVKSFGRNGAGEGEFCYPFCITSCADSFIHMCDDCWNNRVQIF